LSENSELQAEHSEWREARSTFLVDLKVPGSAARAEGWQKHYQRGVDLDGNPGPPSHRTRSNLKPFKHEPSPR
jgi:hypothetical protein